MKLKLHFLMLLVTVALSSLLLAAFAQKGNPKEVKVIKDKPKKDKNPGKSGEAPGRNKDAPFDLGISLLIGAGAAYGIKKALDKRKKRTMPI